MDFRIVFAIALVLVLFSSAYSLDAFGDHDIRGKSAYFFDCSGRGGGNTLHETVTRKFVEGNNSAGTRVRKAMQAVKSLAQEVRLEVQHQKNMQF